MRFKLSSLLLIVALAACSFQVDVIETPVPSQTAVSVERSTSTALPTADNSATPPPTSTALPTVEVASTFPAGDVAQIVFPANGTAQVLVGDLPQGESQTYALTAMQGQVMAVSIWSEDPSAQNTFKVEIKGSDNTVLCPIDTYTCAFWRGRLPATQEYRIRVTTSAGGTFKLRVAINPPGMANQYFDYADSQGRYSLSYSDEFGPMNYAGVAGLKFPAEFALQYVDTDQYASTNLSEAYLLIGSSSDPQAVSTCTVPASLGGPETDLENVTINGSSFVRSRGGGVAAGNIYEQVFYRTVHEETCYEISYFLHYGNIGNYDPGAVTEFDRDALLKAFDEVLATLTLK